TLAAIQLGAGVILGGSAMAAEFGVWPGVWYGIGCGGGLILAGLLVAARMRRQGGYVPLDFFGAKYGERKGVRVWGWMSNIPSLLGIFVAQLMAAGSIMTIFGFGYTQGIVIVAVAIMLYSAIGGMWGVVTVDFVQLGTIVVGIPLVAVVALLKSGDVAALGGILSTPFIPAGMGSRAIFLIVPFLLSISVSYDAFMRYQSSKSETVAKWGCILAGIIVIALSLCVGVIGAVGRSLYPEIGHQEVLPHTIEALLHPVAAGLVVSALLAAVMSSSNCLLISLSACFTRDLYNKVFNPGVSLDDLPHTKIISRAVIAMSAVAGIVLASRASGILDTIIIFNYPYMGSMLVPLLGGVLFPRATAKGAIAAIFVGGAIGVVSFLAGIPGRIHGLFNIDLGLFIAYAASTVVFVAVSLYTSPSTRRV
ncbi:MAG: sodium:solute symporter family protein, partial [Gemmatimonadetes bacterium]|nr:sodium:solute symporter family protein [Gemmatimonadota bacterium]